MQTEQNPNSGFGGKLIAAMLLFALFIGVTAPIWMIILGFWLAYR